MKGAHTGLETVYFPVLVKQIYFRYLLIILVEILLCANVHENKKKKKKEKAWGFQTWHFYWSFSSDIVAVKVLTFSLPGLPRRYSENDQ